jgi:hypothetical protein
LEEAHALAAWSVCMHHMSHFWRLYKQLDVLFSFHFLQLCVCEVANFSRPLFTPELPRRSDEAYITMDITPEIAALIKNIPP